MANTTGKQTIWWGSYTFDLEQAGYWRVGPRSLWIYRTRHSWRLLQSNEADPLDDSMEISLSVPYMETPFETEPGILQSTTSRFCFHKTDSVLHISPLLADRAVVVRPEKPLYILKGETMTLYVSMPLWMCIEVGSPARLLQEVPTYRPSDTWFGPSTQEGELCYALRTAGRMNFQDLPLRASRAITPVIVRNEAGHTLPLERIRIPVQYLSLYQASNSFLWTEPVTFIRKEGDDLAEFNLGEEAPPEAKSASLIVGPRESTTKNIIVRAFSSLFLR